MNLLKTTFYLMHPTEFEKKCSYRIELRKKFNLHLIWGSVAVCFALYRGENIILNDFLTIALSCRLKTEKFYLYLVKFILDSAVEIEKVTQVVVQLRVFLRLRLTQLVLLRSDRKQSVSLMNTGFAPFS